MQTATHTEIDRHADADRHGRYANRHADTDTFTRNPNRHTKYKQYKTAMTHNTL